MLDTSISTKQKHMIRRNGAHTVSNNAEEKMIEEGRGCKRRRVVVVLCIVIIIIISIISIK